jgi:hypothetical protein
MNKKQSNFIEAHIEKVALLLGVLGALYILYAFVLGGGTVVTIDGQQLRPGQIDIHIAEQAEILKNQLDRAPTPKPAYVPQSVNFVAKMNSVLDSNLNVFWPVPSSTEMSVDKKYRIPVIGHANDVSVEHIRAAAYMPKVPVTSENAADEGTYEANDLDLVTVQSNFDLAQLIDSFQDCFNGKNVPERWRDSVLAKPVFAGVQLQRKRFGDDGQWSEWEDIGRPKIDPTRNDYKIKENVSDLSNGGVMVELAKFSDPRIQASLLQPETYKIASAEEQWFPPTLHSKYLTVQREKEAQERREAATEREAKAAEERERITTARPAREERPTRDERGSGGIGDRGRGTTTSRTSSGSRGGGMNRGGMDTRGGSSRNPSRTTTRPDRGEQIRDRRTDTTTAADQKSTTKPAVTEMTINEEMRKMRLERKDISSLREWVTFWAFDDTVEPGASYRYRIRFGVFNPVAGTGQVAAEYAAANSKVVLWSDYAEIEDVVEIPERIYFFPVNVQETAKAVEVQVCKYALGYWHSEQFMVKRGDVIGKAAKVTVSEKDKEAGVKLPESIDYTTGITLVDIIAMNDWIGDKTLQSRQYFDMLFSFDGTSVGRLAAKQMYWPEDLRLKYTELKALEKKTKAPLRDWSGAGIETIQRTTPGMPGDRRGRDQMMDDMMRMRMGDRAPSP